MKYICHKHYKGIATSGKQVNIHRGEHCELDKEWLYREDEIICAVNSFVGCQHFARDDDGHGLERGSLTFAIAHRQRIRKWKNGRTARFSEEEIEMLEREYQRFLKPFDVILFNNDFYAADIDDLREMAGKLGIKA